MKLWRKRRPYVIEGEVKELTTQFHITLRANHARTRKVDGRLAPADAERLDQLLDPTQPHTWSEAYEAEQMLVDTFDDRTLETESAVRTLEATKTLSPKVAAFYADGLSKARSGVERQGLLARLVNDLQWRYTVNEVKRRYATEITRRTSWSFFFSLAAFGIAVGLIAYWQVPINDRVLLVVAALAGTWGATFSMLASLKGRLSGSELNDMKLMRPRVVLLSRALIGTGAGCVFYFLIRSGLLKGNAFPDFDALDGGGFPEEQLALLIVWCFIAGFSEKLVPSLLEKTEARAAAPTAEPDRFRPAAGIAAGDGARAETGGAKGQHANAGTGRAEGKPSPRG